MERTEIVSLFKNTPADGTEITVCGWAKNIRDSKNIGFILSLQDQEQQLNLKYLEHLVLIFHLPF